MLTTGSVVSAHLTGSVGLVASMLAELGLRSPTSALMRAGAAVSPSGLANMPPQLSEEAENPAIQTLQASKVLLPGGECQQCSLFPPAGTVPTALLAGSGVSSQ